MLLRSQQAETSTDTMRLSKNWLLIFLIGLLSCCGCAAEQADKNPLRNLTERQQEWFDRTSQGWMF